MVLCYGSPSKPIQVLIVKGVIRLASNTVHLTSTCTADSVLSASWELSHFIIMATLTGRFYYYLSLTNKEKEYREFR